jgi:hypothetical protein
MRAWAKSAKMRLAFFVGVGQRAAGGGLADAGVMEFRAEGSQTDFDVAQTFTPSQLGEGQNKELFVGGQFADVEVRKNLTGRWCNPASPRLNPCQPRPWPPASSQRAKSGSYVAT